MGQVSESKLSDVGTEMRSLLAEVRYLLVTNWSHLPAAVSLVDKFPGMADRTRSIFVSLDTLNSVKSGMSGAVYAHEQKALASHHDRPDHGIEFFGVAGGGSGGATLPGVVEYGGNTNSRDIAVRQDIEVCVCSKT